MKKGSDREKRDLFAEREPDVGSVKVKETLLPPPSFGFTGGVGARNENSVLFRVDQLASVGTARVKTPEPTRAPATPVLDSRGVDDEGVIDLKALASTPPRGMMRAPVAPLFSEPPPVTLEVDDSSQRATAPTSKLRIIGGIAAAAVFLLAAGFGVSVAFRGEEPVKHAPAAIAAPPPPPVVAPAPTVEPPPAPAASSEDPKDTKAKKKKGKAAKGPITNKTPVPAVKAAPKPADPCGCKGDFNCILACTAKNGK